jgi:hypothetical protein
MGPRREQWTQKMTTGTVKIIAKISLLSHCHRNTDINN